MCLSARSTSGHQVPVSGRYQYDPNPRVRDGMTNIWRVLVDEPRKAVDQHFDAILRELLREMGGKLWRNREAAALAIADLLQVGAPLGSSCKGRTLSVCRTAWEVVRGVLGRAS